MASKLLQERVVYKPFEYPKAFDYWLKQQQAHWLHTEVPMSQDVTDWNSNLKDYEKNVVGQILKGFAQTETIVNDYWSTLVTKWFRKPEVIMMGTTLGSSETIHAEAYSLLNEQLGLDEIGFFVRFENVLNLPVRKRPGDLLHSSDGRVLELGNIAIAETNRSDEEHALAVQKKIAELRLNGSINTNFDDKIIDKDSKKNTGREESAIIDGGIRPSGIYAQGELITKDPVIGLDEAHDSYVILVDSQGSIYELKLDE